MNAHNGVESLSLSRFYLFVGVNSIWNFRAAAIESGEKASWQCFGVVRRHVSSLSTFTAQFEWEAEEKILSIQIDVDRGLVVMICHLFAIV